MVKCSWLNASLVVMEEVCKKSSLSTVSWGTPVQSSAKRWKVFFTLQATWLYLTNFEFQNRNPCHHVCQMFQFVQYFPTTFCNHHNPPPAPHMAHTISGVSLIQNMRKNSLMSFLWSLLVLSTCMTIRMFIEFVHPCLSLTVLYQRFFGLLWTL